MSGFPSIEAFLRVIEDTAKRCNGKKIASICLRLGSDVILPDNTSAFLECILKGTAARGVEIYIKRGHYAGRCRRCGLVFANERHNYCPDCGNESDSIVLGKRFIIEAVEIEA